MQTERTDGSDTRKSPRPSGAPGRRLVLVVEDDPDCRAIYRTVLRASGYDVLETGNGTDGLRLAGEHVPDVILMDLGVPGTDGLVATRMLRAARATAGIPVVAVTGYAQPEHEAQAREAGCAAFVAKPVAPNEIVAVIGRVLPAPPAA